MNLGQIVNRTQRQVGDTSGSVFLRTDVVDWANEGQIEIVRKTECLTKHQQTNVIAGDKDYQLPTDFLMMKRVTLDDRVLEKKSLEDLDLVDVYNDSYGTGTPDYWYESAGVLFLFPTPSVSGSGNLDIWYVRQPATLVNDADTPEIPLWMHKNLVQYCIAQAKELDDDSQGQSQAQSKFDKDVAEAQHELHSQPVDSYPSVRSLPGDMY